MAQAVPAAEFSRNFGRYKLQAQREAVPVSSNGTLAGYFVAPHEYEEYRRLKRRRREVLGIEDFTDADAEAVRRSEAPPESAAFNNELKP